MSQVLILIRHVESTKNYVPTFSSKSGEEGITENGKEQAKQIEEAVHRIAKDGIMNQTSIFCSPTVRARETCAMVFKGNQSLITEKKTLSPIRSPYPGLTELEVRDIDPEFISNLSQYRSGIRSAYDTPRGGGESILEFEDRIRRTIEEIINIGSKYNIIVGHRSTLTAILLWAARKHCSYPMTWYGHIVLPLGTISVIRNSGKEIESIDYVATHPSDII